MSADKRTQNWILVLIILIIAVAVPMYKVKLGEPAVKQGIDLVGGVDLLLQAQVPEGMTEVTPDMMAGAMDVLRNRIDPEGVKEIVLQQMGTDRVVLQIPGEDDPERVKELIGTTASLKFLDVGNTPLSAGTIVRFVDPETGQPVLDPGMISSTPETTSAPVDTTPEEPGATTTVTQEQVVITSDLIGGFSLPETVTNTGETGASTVTPEQGALTGTSTQIAGLDLEVNTLQHSVYTSQHIGGYLALTVDNKIVALHPITEGISGSKIFFPNLGTEPGFDLEAFSQNIDKMQVIGFEAPPPAIGTIVEVFNPMGQQAEQPATDGTAQAPTVDIATDKIILTGDDFADATVTFGRVNEPMISFTFKDSGRQIFGRFTAQHVQQYLAIALDDKIISCPVIREPILNGRGVIEGSFTNAEAQDLVIKLDSGRMPVTMLVIENRTVGPTLGQKSIDDSKRAAILGAMLVILFMLVYYRLPGLLADVALIFYAIVTFGALSLMNATLTLPGIAGFIMSIGMAVDANVIIFERLKEELRTGKTYRSAVEVAFKRAFVAIFDSNITTIMAAVVLYNLGTGPIRGFAVTLSLGVLVSMFSAITLTRLLIETALDTKSIQIYSYFGVKEEDVATHSTGGGKK